MNHPMELCPACGDPFPPGRHGHCPRCLLFTTLLADNNPSAEISAPWTRLQGLELHEEIGRGGMGVVYRARQINLDRMVAVKILLGARFADTEALERFHLEARAAARLDHPGIVRMFDVGEEDGIPWFSMEWVPGCNLEEHVRRSPASAAMAARWVSELADAVGHAHARGILHRDLKPSNVLVDPENRPRITDFGIARMAAPEEANRSLTLTGQLLGSPGYAAPEQSLHGHADARTDVYGLGAVLYHLLSGRPPFSGPTLESVLLQLRENEPISPRVFHPALSRDLEIICRKCLARNPAARYGSAGELAADLRRHLRGEPILARPPGVWERTWKWVVRHPAVASVLISVLVLAGVLVGASLWFAADKARSEHRISLLAEARNLRQTRLGGWRTRALEKLGAAREIAPSREILDEAVAALVLPDLAWLGRRSPSASQAADLIPAGIELQEEAGFLVARDRITGKETARFPVAGPTGAATTDESGQRLARATAGSRILVISDTQGNKLAECPHPLGVEDVAWSGDLIATTCENRFIYIWNTLGQLKHRLSGHDSPGIRVAFRPFSQFLASTAADNHVRIWHAGRGQDVLRLEHAHDGHLALWWSASGQRLVGRSRDGSVDVYGMTGGEALRVFSPPQEEPHSENLGSADFSSDGSLAVTIDENSARVWDLVAGKLLYEHPKETGQWLGARFAPNGEAIYTCGWTDPLTVWRIPMGGPDRKIERVFPPLLDETGHLLRDVSADGKFIALSNNGSGIYTVVDKDGSRITTIHQPATLACSIAPDGSWLATSSYSRPGANIWHLPGGEKALGICPGETIMQTLPLGENRLLTKSSLHIRIFDTRSWTELPGPAAGLQLRSLATTRDGRWVAGLGSHDIRILETTGFREILRLIPPEHAGWLGECHVAFDASGHYLMVQTAFGAVLRWDLAFLHRELCRLGFPSPLGEP